ncbi:hypothetical protein K493DRAFT_32535 [Basidiobolus meristosporus CBS 931.73]|uniref:Membrane insertase YidC/Oxa/ALB C-terminal domain-containing protein n=1 Tax=Basidiobolus meristosporus CBS 931.73 TaxID=1314790 RepID=A0A1Y1Y887_9FUNG|nr:hypothetical protein K493DRAFT_32535 [Basidiobolus meristosporus CBS 931.73]|eukprot:ORX94085.1 hypothetical protein K493DRAFT_32535 [Basidiobolus meristosporus CBS 931.73]
MLLNSTSQLRRAWLYNGAPLRRSPIQKLLSPLSLRNQTPQLLASRKYLSTESTSLDTTTSTLGQDTNLVGNNLGDSLDIVTTSSQDTLPFFIECTKTIFEAVHQGTALPWWATIISTTFLLRTVATFPIALYQQRSIGRMLALRPVVLSWGETLKQQIAKDSSRKKFSYEEYNNELQKQYRSKVKALYRQHRCQPIVSFLLPWVQMPLFITLSFTLRDMSGYPIPWLGLSGSNPISGFETGGLAWFTDLTSVDPTWTFPLAIGLTHLANTELNAYFMKQAPTLKQKAIQNIFRGISVFMIPVASQVPMGICLYWLSSSTYSLLQNIAFKVPAVRARLKIQHPEPKKF